MKNTQFKQTESTVSCVEPGHNSKTSLLELGIVALAHLDQLVAEADDLQIYVLISQQEKEWETSVSGAWAWHEVFELDIDLNDSFEISILDKDEYGSDTFLAGFIVPPHFLDYSQADSRTYRLKLVDGTKPELTSSLLCSEHFLGPALTIQVKSIEPEAQLEYYLTMGKHRHVFDKKDPHTRFEVVIHRTDGHSWKTEVRYSSVYELRKQLVRVLPALKSLPFSGKTYFHWLRRVVKGCSRFDEARVTQRKQQIGHFLSMALQYLPSVRCEDLNSLLNLA